MQQLDPEVQEIAPELNRLIDLIVKVRLNAKGDTRDRQELMECFNGLVGTVTVQGQTTTNHSPVAEVGTPKAIDDMEILATTPLKSIGLSPGALRIANQRLGVLWASDLATVHKAGLLSESNLPEASQDELKELHAVVLRYLVCRAENHGISENEDGPWPE